MDIDILLIVTIQFLFPFGENLVTDDDNSRTVIEEEILLDCISDHDLGRNNGMCTVIAHTTEKNAHY